jgi:hypothetical protein
MREWTDIDGAMDELGRALGLIEGFEYRDTKGIFWTKNPLSSALYAMVMQLVEAGVLEHREENDEDLYRWAGYIDADGRRLGCPHLHDRHGRRSSTPLLDP